MKRLEYSNLNDFLRKHVVKKGDNKIITHTRIGNKKLNIFPGSYSIEENELDIFYKLYHRHVFINKNEEYLTEIQNKDGNNQILIDYDFRFDKSINKRVHCEDHIDDLTSLYMEKINQMVNFENDAKIKIYVFERDNIKMMDEFTKDGLHMVIGLKMEHIGQMILREKVLKDIDTVLGDLPLTNTYDSVLDLSISSGSTGWQLFGSQKPGYEAYKIKYEYEYTYVEEDDDFDVEKKILRNPNNLELLPLVSAKYKKMVSYPYNEITKEKVANFKTEKKQNNKKLSKKKIKPIIINNSSNTNYDFSSIKNEEELDGLVFGILESLPHEKYYIKETYKYLMSLPNEYYGPGSYSNWIRVGWALANTDKRLFPLWVKFSSQENCRMTLRDTTDRKFDFDHVPELFDMWCDFDNENDSGLTYRSIMYWAKEGNPNEFHKIRKETIEYYMEQTIKTQVVTESDLAQVLYQLYKDEFRCASIKNKIWYHFRNHRWVEIDSGTTLRYNISRVLSKLYADKSDELTQLASAEESNDVNKFGKIRSLAGKYSQIGTDLKRTAMKQNVMKEVAEIFYEEDPEFMKKLDTKPHLLCFTNGVFDFNEGIFRPGMPEDYISLSTKIPYIPFDSTNEAHVLRKTEIEEFFLQLFPEEELNRYMWEHLASTLIGTNKNQTFNIYNGSGSNGKSKLVELMTMVLGEYKGDVPITLVTQKRTKIGGLSPEVAALKGVRYAVMQEPSKGERLNDGPMKQLTGEDPITGRPMYKEPVTFVPAFKLVVCTNNLFDIKTNDDGTWRRIRLCEFLSKFLEKPYGDERFPKKDYPYQYPVDYDIGNKFERWKFVFMSMLVDIANKTKGVVNDCTMVLKASNDYRKEQDFFTEFLEDKIEKGDEFSVIKRTEVYQEFKSWYEIMYGKGVPKGKDLYDFLDKKIGKYNSGWHGYKIKYDIDNEAGITLNEDY